MDEELAQGSGQESSEVSTHFESRARTLALEAVLKRGTSVLLLSGGSFMVLLRRDDYQGQIRSDDSDGNDT